MAAFFVIIKLFFLKTGWSKEQLYNGMKELQDKSKKNKQIIKNLILSQQAIPKFLDSANNCHSRPNSLFDNHHLKHHLQEENY